MKSLSLGNRTDLAFYGRFAEVIERDNHVIVRNGGAPFGHLGNQIIVRGDVSAEDVGVWIELFRREQPGIEHVTLNVEGTVAEGCAANLHHLEHVVMSLASPFSRVELHPDVVVKRIDDDETWKSFVEWRYEHALERSRPYFHRHFELQKRVCDDGGGAWFYASVDDRPVASLGILDCGDGIARFQGIRTEAAFRRRGIASALMTLALDVARRELGSKLAVIIAATINSEARALYTKLGFGAVGKQSLLSSW